jgi:uncharacterized phiE125 gp8 family phage protein
MDWTGISLKTAPAVEPVTAQEMREFLSLVGTEDDTLLAGLISAARVALEKYTGRTFITTVYQVYYDGFSFLPIKLARPPVQSVVSITYVDVDGVTQTLSSSLYIVDVASLFGRISPAYDEVWPITREQNNAVCIEIKTGYGDAAASVPAPIKVAIKMIVADVYEHREANVELALSENKSLKFLLSPYTIPGVA